MALIKTATIVDNTFEAAAKEQGAANLTMIVDLTTEVSYCPTQKWSYTSPNTSETVYAIVVGQDGVEELRDMVLYYDADPTDDEVRQEIAKQLRCDPCYPSKPREEMETVICEDGEFEDIFGDFRYNLVPKGKK